MSMPGFFRNVVIPAAEVGRHSDAIRLQRREDFEGIIVPDVHDPATCATVCSRLEGGLVRTVLPAPFHAFFFGMKPNLTPGNLVDYFQFCSGFPGASGWGFRQSG